MALILTAVSIISILTVFSKYGENLFCLAAKSPLVNVSRNNESSSNSALVKSVQGSAESKTSVISTDEASSTVKKEESSKSTDSKKSGKKIGKIYSQFFSPYTANTAYNNVYLNNQSGVKIDIKKMISTYISPINAKSEKPQVLIYHTHASENYMTDNSDYYTASDLNRTSNQKKNVIGVGNKIEELLKKGGISVLHDKTLHDNPSYNGSYYRSAVTVEKYLKKYPSIKVVLDIHRDAIGDKDDLVKPVIKVNGKSAAQVMICVGSNTGSVDYYPNWKENLKFGLKLQQTIEVLYPGLARALFLAQDRCYNQNLSKGSLIIEFGTNANTFSEAEYSASLVSKALISVLK